MVQRSCRSGSVPVFFMPVMLGRTNHPSVGKRGIGQSTKPLRYEAVTVGAQRRRHALCVPMMWLKVNLMQ